MKSKVQSMMAASTTDAKPERSSESGRPERLSTTTKKPPKSPAQATDERLAELLYSNRMNLLASFCESSCAGETAATMAPCILQVVDYAELSSKRMTNSQEKFIKRLLKKRVLIFAEKGWDLSDVLRDNSMATLVLNSYIRREGKEYMMACLERPIQDALSIIEDCEMDPEKLAKELATPEFTPTAEEIKIRLLENERRLKSVVSSIIVSVLEKRALIPERIRSICCFLKCVIEDNTKEVSPAPVPTKTADSIIVGSLPYESLVAYAAASGYPGFAGLSTVAATSVDVGITVNSMGKLNEEDSISSTAQQQEEAEQRSQMRASEEQPAVLTDSEPTTPPAPPSKLLATDSKSSTSPGSSSPIYSNPTLTGSQKPRGFVRTSLDNVLLMAKSRSSTNTSRVASFSAASPTRGTLQKKMSIDSQARPKLIIYSNFEKVVASALFLRFFLPAITTPDVSGLCAGPIKSKGRRGFVLVGKILQAICNDVDFGTKDSFLVNFNPFLYEYRDKVRDFLSHVSDYSGLDMHALRNTRPSDEEIQNIHTAPLKPKNKLISKLALRSGNAKSVDQIFSSTKRKEMTKFEDYALASNPEIVDSKPCPPTTRMYDLTATSLAPLFEFLGKNVAKFQDHIDSTLAKLSPEEAEGMQENFEELKSILANSVYSPNGPAKSEKRSLSKKLRSYFTSSS